MAKPKILILDESSLGVASIVVREVRSIIFSGRDKFEAAVLLVEQNASLALAIIDRGYIMQNGRVVTAAAIQELRCVDLVRENYLGDRQGWARPLGGAARSASLQRRQRPAGLGANRSRATRSALLAERPTSRRKSHA
jgi:branched-chain amino acid transport system ATP-binding protein